MFRNAGKSVYSVVLILFCSCAAPRDTFVQDVGRLMDPVGKAIEEYGSVAVSSPLLVDPRKLPADGTGFSLKKTPDDYYDDARKDAQGGVSTLFQQASESLTGVQFRGNVQNFVENQLIMDRFKEQQTAYRRKQVLNDAGQFVNVLLPFVDPKLAYLQEVEKESEDAESTSGGTVGGAENGTGESTDGGSTDSTTKTDTSSKKPIIEPEKVKLTPEEERIQRLEKVVEAMGASSKGLMGPSEPPPLPEFVHDPPEFDPDLLPNTDLVKQVIANEKFGNFQSLLERFKAEPPKVANRSAIITAAGDTMVEAINTILGKPMLDKDWDDKIVLMGVSMVSVAPGTRTIRGYAAEVSMTVNYRYEPARFEVIKRLLERDDPYLRTITEAIMQAALNDPVALAFRKLRDAEEITEVKQRQIAELNTAMLGESRPTDDQQRALGALNQEIGKLLAERESLRKVYSELVIGLPGTAERVRSSSLDGISSAILEPQMLPTGWQLGESKIPGRPLVGAVSPMTEVQTLDLASSIRQQQAFALRVALIVAGFGAEAQAQHIFQYIERLEQDAATRTPMNTVAAFSNAGGVFGYQIGPSLQGVADFVPGGYTGGPAGALKWLTRGMYRPGPDWILQRQSFPAMLLIGMNKADLALKVQRVMLSDGTVRHYIVEPVLEFQQTTRWIPLPHSEADDSQEDRPTICETQRLQWMYDLIDARNIASATRDANAKLGSCPDQMRNSAKYETLAGYVNSRADVMQSQAVLASSFQRLPTDLLVLKPECPVPPKVPMIVGAAPQIFQLQLDADQTKAQGKPIHQLFEGDAAITGRNLKELNDAVEPTIVPRIAGVDVKWKTSSNEYEIYDSAAILAISIQDNGVEFVRPRNFQVGLPYTQPDGVKALLLTHTFTIMPAPTAAVPKPPDSVSLKRIRNGPPGTAQTDEVNLPPGLSVDVARSFIVGRESDKGDDATVNVNVQSKVDKDKEDP